MSFTYAPESVQLMTRPDGSTRRIQEDQSILETVATGAVRTLVLANGVSTVRQGDGTWRASGTDGVHTFDTSGRARSLERADGVIIRFHADATSEGSTPSVSSSTTPKA